MFQLSTIRLKIRKNYRAISEKNTELMDGQIGRRTDGQTHNGDFIGPSIERGSNNVMSQSQKNPLISRAR